MRIFNATKKTLVADNARLADTFLSRLIGLINRAHLSLGEALIITRCQSIHMFFMRFAIDAIFIDKENKVVGLVSNIQPWQLSPIFFRATRVLECPPQTISLTKTTLSDLISIE